MIKVILIVSVLLNIFLILKMISFSREFMKLINNLDDFSDKLNEMSKDKSSEYKKAIFDVRKLISNILF